MKRIISNTEAEHSMNFLPVSFFFPGRVGRLAAAMAIVFLLGACAATPVKQRDYTAFKESRPRSILVMSPVNQSPEIKADRKSVV